MARLSELSLARLGTCHPSLIRVVKEVAEHFPCKVITGHRGKEAQDEAFARGNSKVEWPNGNHNAVPSRAVDVMPSPIDWHDRERMTYFAGQVVATARSMGIKIRWGGDWNQNTDLSDNRFDDLVHFELTE